MPGLINLDFADVKTIMSGMGMAMMGTGDHVGREPHPRRGERGDFEPASGGRLSAGRQGGVIVNVTGGQDLSLLEVNEALTLIQEAAHEDAHIIFGAVVDPSLDGRVKVTVIATGFDSPATAEGGEFREKPDARGFATLQRVSQGAHGRRPSGGSHAAPIARRQALGLSFGQSALPATAAIIDAADVDLDPPSAFDVPAFLRQEG